MFVVYNIIRRLQSLEWVIIDKFKVHRVLQVSILYRDSPVLTVFCAWLAQPHLLAPLATLIRVIAGEGPGDGLSLEHGEEVVHLCALILLLPTK